MRVLFLDDAPWRHKLVDEKLAGQDIVHAWTVDEAIEALKSSIFDIVYLDHDLNDFVKETGKGSSYTGMYGGQTELTGRDVSVWMARTMCNMANKPEVIVHSWNNTGAPSMVRDLQDAGFNASWQLFNGGICPE
jgi:CheY-like chemotaxis protein